jgi:hypothetical protein
MSFAPDAALKPTTVTEKHPKEIRNIYAFLAASNSEEVPPEGNPL